MSKFIDKILGIIIVIICITLCKTCTSDYLKGGDNKAISNYEKMIFENSKITAQLYPNYKEITIKVMKIPMKTYQFRYHFDINGIKYEGQHSFLTELPKSNSLDVFYLKDDPNFNCVDPNEQLSNEKEKNSSNKNLYWGIGWGVFGLFTLIGMFIKDNEKKEE